MQTYFHKIRIKYYKAAIYFFGLSILLISGCRKPEDDPNDGGITPMYGVQQSTFQKMPIIEQDLSIQQDNIIIE